MNVTKGQTWFINLWARMRCDVPHKMSDTHEFFSFVLWKLQDFPETLYTRREKFSLFISLKSVHEMWLGPSPSFDTLCKFIQTRNYVVSVFTVL